MPPTVKNAAKRPAPKPKESSARRYSAQERAIRKALAMVEQYARDNGIDLKKAVQ